MQKLFQADFAGSRLRSELRFLDLQVLAEPCDVREQFDRHDVGRLFCVELVEDAGIVVPE